MTFPVAERVKRRRIRRADQRLTMAGDLLAEVRHLLDESRTLRWPAAKYADAPVEFCEEILGFEPWGRQREILEALRDTGFVAVSSGRKTGKSRVASAAAHHYYATVPGGQVFVHAPRNDQIEGILWREIALLHRQSGRCLECRLRQPDGPRPCPHSAILDGELSPRASTGLRAPDGRIVTSITSKTVEAVSGYSGEQFWIVDESAGVDDLIFDTIDGNGLGGGLKVLYLGNPTKNRGRFFEIFHNEKRGKSYHRVQMSSVEASQARDRQGKRFGHLASEEKIEEYRELWGEDSPLFTVHVLGQHALNEDGAVFSVERIAEAVARWHDDPGEGRLYLGVDPAGASGLGDETAITPRRGTKAFEILTYRGLDQYALLDEILHLVETHKKDRETPVVVVDREGAVGSLLHAAIVEYLARFRAPRRPPFEYLPVRASAHAERMPQAYPRVRDELIANMERWVRTGSIPDDDKLAAELNAIRWIEQIDQRLKATPKEELKRLLERSPDRMDSLALACWDSLSLRVQDGADLPPSAAAAVDRDRVAIRASRKLAGGWEGFDTSDLSEPRRPDRRDPHRVLKQRGRRSR